MNYTNLENIILEGLFFNEDYMRRVIPYLKEEYFESKDQIRKSIFRHAFKFINKYNALPTPEAIFISIQNDSSIPDDIEPEIESQLKAFSQENAKKYELEWLKDKTEEWCQERAFINAAYKVIGIAEGAEKKLSRGDIPGLFEEALGITFDPSIGHDYFDDADLRYDYYHDTPHKVKFRIDILNKMTKGGVQLGTLNLLVAGPYVGKTLGLCSLAADYLKDGQDVLYISCEIAEEEVAKRVDLNLLNLSEEDLALIPKDKWNKIIEKLHSQTPGKLKFKRYPASAVNANNFRALIHDYKIKYGFIPKIIIVDYLNIVASVKSFKSADNTYGSVKSVAEELRALAVELEIPIWSAIQLNREGAEDSDPGMSDVADSFGISMTADLMWGIIRNQQLDELNQILIVQMKTRYMDAGECKRFYIGVHRQKFRWYEVEQIAQSTNNSHKEEKITPNQTEKDKILEKLNISPKFGKTKKVNFDDFIV